MACPSPVGSLALARFLVDSIGRSGDRRLPPADFFRRRTDDDVFAIRVTLEFRLHIEPSFEAADTSEKAAGRGEWGLP